MSPLPHVAGALAACAALGLAPSPARAAPHLVNADALAGAPLAEVCEAFAPAEAPAREAFEELSSWLAEGWITGAGDPAVPRMAAASDDGSAIAGRGGPSAAGGAASTAGRQEGAR
jgi:hypothetical protein